MTAHASDRPDARQPNGSSQLRAGIPDDQLILSVRRLSRRFGGLQAVDDVSFGIRKGEIAAMIGPNGAGKTTTFNLISGYLRPDSGVVIFNESDVTRRAPHLLARAGLVRSFQTARVFPSMSVGDIVTTAAMIHHRQRAARTKADEVLSDLGLSGMSNKGADELSLPDRQLVELAKCVAMDPALIMLDEIMGGLNREECAVPVAAIRRLAERGISFLLVEHVMPIVMSLAEHIVVLDFGRRIAAGTPREIAVNPDVQRSYLGGAA